MNALSGRRFVIASVAYAVLHVSFAAAARMFEVSPGVSLWYPPVGFMLAFFIFSGLRAAPVVLTVSVVAAVAMRGLPVNPLSVALATMIAGIYGFFGCTVHRMFGAQPMPSTPARTTILVSLLLAAPVVAALTGVLMVAAAGHLSVAQVPSLAFRWWIGDAMGVLTVTPLCLVHVVPRLRRSATTAPRGLRRREVLEITAQAMTVLGCLGAVQGFGFVHARESLYLCFVPLVWISLRHGLRGSTLAVFAITMGSLATVRIAGASTNALLDLLLFELAVASIGLGLGTAVTRRAGVEKERSRLFAILEATPEYIVTIDLGGRVLFENAAFLRLRGADATSARGRPLTDFLPESAALKLLGEGIPTALQQGLWQGETAVLAADRQEIPVAQRLIVHYDDQGQPAMISSVARDVTAEKQAEQARLQSERNMLQTQKLESLGVLAGGIAHDFNNLLTVVLGNATLARLDVVADSPAERAVHQIELAALRAAELCRQMLAYSGKGQIASQLVDLSGLVDQTIHLLKVSVSKKCSLEFDLARELPAVKGDATQLSQITMNLVMNASDACGEKGGEIVVRTGVKHADRAYLANMYLAPDLAPGRYVFLEVSDDGCGMSPEVVARIFEPFFTTKFKGHGLGLSAVLGIARSHQGAIKVESAPGRGTTFQLLLPVAAGLAAPRPAASPEIGTWRGSGRVLVVDDEEPVREITARLLERFGFSPVLAENGREAVELFRAEPQGFRVVLLDLSMPVMNGAEAFREIHRLNADVPVLLMSGYNKTDSKARFGGDGLAGFIQKPFDAARLGDLLRTVVERERSPAK